MQKPLRRCACVFVLALAFMATGASILRGQTVTATLTGTIADQTGAIVPGVTVTAINQGTQIEYTAESNSAGVYTIPFLPIGTYVVSAELTGFKKAVTNPIKLEVNQTARIDLKLEVGQISDTVSV
ncbi:MAG: TonB-dependent receptor, partial [Acidobacteria bacterium]